MRQAFTGVAALVLLGSVSALVLSHHLTRVKFSKHASRVNNQSSAGQPQTSDQIVRVPATSSATPVVDTSNEAMSSSQPSASAATPARSAPVSAATVTPGLDPSLAVHATPSVSADGTTKMQRVLATDRKVTGLGTGRTEIAEAVGKESAFNPSPSEVRSVPQPITATTAKAKPTAVPVELPTRNN